MEREERGLWSTLRPGFLSVLVSKRTKRGKQGCQELNSTQLDLTQLDSSIDRLDCKGLDWTGLDST